MNPQLDKAINDAIAEGVQPLYLADSLVQQGWPAEDVNQALEVWLQAHAPQQKTDKFKTWVKKYYKLAIPGVAAMVVLNTISSGISLLRPIPVKIMADSAFGGEPAPSILARYKGPQLILAVSALTLLIFLIGELFDLIRDRLLLKIGYHLNRLIKAESFRHILHLPLFHQERLAKGDYIYRQNTVTSSLSDLVLGSTSSIIESVILIIGVLVIMLKLNAPLTLISAVVIPFLFLTIKLVGPRLGKIAQALTELASKTSSHITESVDNAETVQAFTLEDRQVKQLNDMWNESYVLAKRSMAWGKVFNFSNGLLVILGTSAVMYFGGTSVLDGKMSLGDLLMFLTYMNYLLGPVQQIADQITSRRQKLLDVHRIYEVLSDHEGIEDIRKDAHLPPLKGWVQFDHVSYSYDQHQVLNDISLTIKPGEKVAIIGPSGGGKSTILKLVGQFVSPSKGRILVDGYDIEQVSMHELRRGIAWVSQTPQLFSKSITENIMDGDVYRQVTAEEIGFAAQLANLPEFVNKLPLGYNSPAGENGSSLSGGQRQRIAIARAVLKNAPIICMDEPTSALDDKSEELIRQSITQLIQNKTVILVTHRPSLLSAMDTIYVLEAGKLRNVTEYGGYERYMAYLAEREEI